MRIVTWSLIALAISLVGLFQYFYKPSVTVVPATEEATSPEAETALDTTPSTPQISALAQITQFTNDEYGFGFKFRIKPYGYSTFENSLVQNRELETFFGVTLVRSDDYDESVRAAAEGNAYDGPPGITVSVYPLTAADTTIDEWLLSNRQISNCEEGSILATVLSNNDASSCLWDGLYQGVTVGVVHNNRVYLLTGTREDEETTDGYSYAKDFNEVVRSFELI